jgi:lysophospholipase L1-like esterase
VPLPHGTSPVLGEDHPGYLEYLYVPGTQQVRYSQADWDAEVVVKTANIGPHGFRASDFPAVKAAGVLRIACTGDSMTFGRGVDDDETWPAQLQRALEPELDGAVEVWNCGLEGTDSEDHLGMVRDVILRYDPDVVLLGYYINDVECGPLPRRDSAAGPLENVLAGFVRPNSGWWKDCLGFVRSRSVLADTAFERLHRALDGEISLSVYNAAYERETIGWRRAQKYLRAIRDLLAERGVGFGIVLIPQMNRVRAGQLASHDAYAIVQDFCRAEQIPVLDTEPLFAGCDPSALVVHPLDRHLNGAAFAILAPAIAEFLDEQGWLAARDQRELPSGGGE